MSFNNWLKEVHLCYEYGPYVKLQKLLYLQKLWWLETVNKTHAAAACHIKKL